MNDEEADGQGGHEDVWAFVGRSFGTSDEGLNDQGLHVGITTCEPYPVVARRPQLSADEVAVVERGDDRRRLVVLERRDGLGRPSCDVDLLMGLRLVR
jgi:hypothetical protein